MRPTQEELKQFVDVVVAALQGDLDARIPISDPPDEWAAACAALNIAVEELGGRIESLNQLSEERGRLIDELQRTRVALENTEKIALLGRLAASVGHEVNNPATILSLGIGEMLAELDTEETKRRGDPFLSRMRRNLLECDEAVGRIGNIANGMRGFGRPGVSNVEEVDLAELARTALQLTRNDIRHGAVIQESLATVPPVLAGRGELVQVLVNLMLNAAEAMRDLPLSDSRLTVLCSLDGDEVVVAVEDSGPGVPVEQGEQIFDPFYSTKGTGALGLGLAISREIVQRNSGTLEVGDAPGGGARFAVRLPVAANTSAESGLGTRSQAATVRRVLVIDDEAALCRVLARILKSAGHDAVIANSGEVALKILRQDQGFDAIVCDLMMPGISGVEVLQFLEDNHPELLPRTMILTGGALNAPATRAIRQHSKRVVQKPVGPDEFLAAVHAILSVE